MRTRRQLDASHTAAMGGHPEPVACLQSGGHGRRSTANLLDLTLLPSASLDPTQVTATWPAQDW